MMQFLYGFLAALIVPILALFAAGYIGVIPQIKPLVVQSGSMAPAIKTGSVVFIQKSPGYKDGDVIAFKPEGRSSIVTHRIVSIDDTPDVKSGSTARSHIGSGTGEGGPTEASFQTKGDANEEADPWKVASEQISGKVILYIPGLGFGVDFVKQPKGFVLLVIIPAAIIIWEELKVLLGEIVKMFSGMFVRRRQSVIPSSGSPKLMIFVPLVGFFFVAVAVSGAYFLDIDKSLGNVLGAANSFATDLVVSPLEALGPEATQSATPSALVSPAP